MSWFWQLERLPVNAQTRHLYHVLAAHDFQEGLKTYRDLRFLQRNLEEWRMGIDAFSAMLEARERRYVERLGAARERRSPRIGSSGFDERAAALAARASRRSRRARRRGARERRGAGAVGAPRSRRGSGSRGCRTTRRRAPRASATACCAASCAGRSRRSTASACGRSARRMRELDAALAEAHAPARAPDRPPRGGAGVLRGLRGAHRRAGAAHRALRARVDGAVGAQGGALQQLALAEVARQKKRLHAYLTEAQFALAAVYDRAAHAGEQP